MNYDFILYCLVDKKFFIKTSSYHIMHTTAPAAEVYFDILRHSGVGRVAATACLSVRCGTVAGDVMSSPRTSARSDILSERRGLNKNEMQEKRLKTGKNEVASASCAHLLTSAASDWHCYQRLTLKLTPVDELPVSMIQSLAKLERKARGTACGPGMEEEEIEEEIEEVD